MVAIWEILVLQACGAVKPSGATIAVAVVKSDACSRHPMVLDRRARRGRHPGVDPRQRREYFDHVRNRPNRNRADRLDVELARPYVVRG